MLPNAELVGVVFGVVRSVWLNAFSHSLRNCSRAFSAMEKFLMPEMFQMLVPGCLAPEKRDDSMMMFCASWSADLVLKAPVLNQRLIVCWPEGSTISWTG